MQSFPGIRLLTTVTRWMDAWIEPSRDKQRFG